MGLWCAFIGAFVLVTPHRFTSASYDGLAPYRAWWGLLVLASGAALLVAAILRPPRGAGLVIHGTAGATFFAMAASFSRTASWTGVISYALLGAALCLAGFLPYTLPTPAPSASPAKTGGRDLLALTMGTIGLVIGLATLCTPALFRGAAFDPGRQWLPFLGIGLMAGGALLWWVSLRPAPLSRVWLAHLTAGTAFILFGLVAAWPLRAWTGVALYIGVGGALALLPGFSRRLAHLDTRALRTRLALALAGATSAALILTVAVATTQEERLSKEQILETQKIEAQSIARTVADYLALNAARTATMAAMAGRVPMEPAAQRAFLARLLPHDAVRTGLAALDRSGRVLAIAGDVPFAAVDWRDLVTDVSRHDSVAVQLVVPPGEAAPRFVLGAPVLALDGAPAGALVAVIKEGALAQRIERASSTVTLADGHGRTIVRREGTETGPVPVLPAGWDGRVAAGRKVRMLDRLAAFAVVPHLGWVVAVERPQQAALAGVRSGRDLAFLLLLAVVPLAVLSGIIAARRIARPLRTLADAVDEMTAGNPGAPLGSSSISEVARLSTAFAVMRDRLAARTRESERLATELHARAEALADSDRRKDEFLAMLGHELRNPLGAIANAAYLLGRAPDGSTSERALGIIQRQIQHLVRLVDDLLDVSRITRGKVELRRGRVDLADVIRHAVEMTRPLIEAKSHSVQVELPPGPLPLDADATRLEQVVGNLLRNAAKYTEDGGRIEVAVRRENGFALVHVRDNGMGIAPDLLPRIFDLFTQGEQGLDRAGAGLGIGLTLVRSLVEMHGGGVTARSAGPGKGSEMEVRLPLV